MKTFILILRHGELGSHVSRIDDDEDTECDDCVTAFTALISRSCPVTHFICAGGDNLPVLGN